MHVVRPQGLKEFAST